jgi:hypothetical protein
MVKSKGKRIGWLFPIIAISSDNHDYKSNKHFHIYAFIAMQFLANKYFNKFFEANTIIRFDQIELPRNYILVVNRERAKDAEFNINKCYLSIARFGIFNTDLNKINFEHYDDFDETDSLTIESISFLDEIQTHIDNVLSKYLPAVSDPIFAFFIIYQLFEILIADLHELEKHALLNRIPELQSRSLRDTLERLKGYLNESTALRKLTESTPNKNYLEIFNEARDLLITETRTDTDEAWIDSIYALRNSLFHSYLRTGAQSPEIIGKILPTFLDALFETTKTHSNRRAGQAAAPST